MVKKKELKNITISFPRKLSTDIRKILKSHGYDSLRVFVIESARNRYEELERDDD